jgi:heme-degrading monooxygenase HmoA
MFVILFESRLSADAGEEYDTTEDFLRERVRALAGSDLMEVRKYTGENGERLAVLYWNGPETLEQWRADPAHRAAKQLGREKWYESYELTVAEVVRTSTGGVQVDTTPLPEPT